MNCSEIGFNGGHGLSGGGGMGGVHGMSGESRMSEVSRMRVELRVGMGILRVELGGCKSAWAS